MTTPVLAPTAKSEGPKTEKIRLKRRKYFTSYYPNGRIQRDGWLRADLYHKIKPPEDVTTEAPPADKASIRRGHQPRLKSNSAQITSVVRNQVTLPDGSPGPLSAYGAHTVWWESVYPAILSMSKAEYDLLIQAVEPDVDPTHLHRYKAPRDCKKGKTGPRGWRKLPQRIPCVVPTAREAQIPWEVARLTGALLHLAGIYERGELTRVILRASYREAAEVIGIAHNNLIPIVREKGERSQGLVLMHRAHPGMGANKRGRNREGGRRHTPAHPANEYQIYISEAALEWARKFRDRHGLPEKPIPYEAAKLPAQVDPVDLEMAKRKWAQLHEDIQNSGQRPDRIKALLRQIARITPVSWERQTNTLTVEGIITPAAVQIIESRCDARVRFLLTAGTYVT